MMCELAELLNNKAMKWLLIKTYEKIYKHRRLLIHQNKYNIDIILSGILSWYMQNVLIMGTFIPIVRHPIIFTIFTIFGYLSDYCVIHIVCISTLIYVIVNLIDYKNTPIDNLSMPLINSFLMKSKLYRKMTNQPIIKTITPDIVEMDDKPIIKGDMNNELIESYHIIPNITINELNSKKILINDSFMIIDNYIK